MPAIIPEKRAPTEASIWRRLAWFVGLYLAGVGTVGVVAYGLRLWLRG